MTEGQLGELVAMWRDGVKAKDIASELGVTRSAVYYHASMHRDLCERRGSGRHRIEVDSRVRRIALLAESTSVAETARHYKLSKRTVGRYKERYREYMEERHG